MKPGTLMLHRAGMAIGVVGADGDLHTHNMSLEPDCVRFWHVVEECPERLLGYLAAARRRRALKEEVAYGNPG